jgi:hypothetical protein
VTEHEAAPALVGVTDRLPLVPELEAETPAPEQLTEAEEALLVCQLNVLAVPTVTVAGLKKV